MCLKRPRLLTNVLIGLASVAALCVYVCVCVDRVSPAYPDPGVDV